MSPMILFILICLCISMPFIVISNRKTYKESPYFRDFRIPFNEKLFHSYSYNFYNYAVDENLPIKYVKQKSNSFEYFIFEEQIFIFPNFKDIKYNKEKQQWEVIYTKNKEKVCSVISLDEYLERQMKSFDDELNLPIKILISRNSFNEEYIDLDSLPEALYVIRNYNCVFKEENKELLSIIAQSTKTLYEMMLKNEKLAGKFELKNNELIVWTFEKVIYEIAISKNDGYFGVFKNNKLKLEIIHWHPDFDEIYDDICNIG